MKYLHHITDPTDESADTDFILYGTGGTKSCHHCNESNLHWVNIGTRLKEIWRLADENNIVHNCPAFKKDKYIKKDEKQVIINFPSEAQAKLFLDWMGEQGAQDYIYYEGENVNCKRISDSITFEYDNKNNKIKCLISPE